MPNPIIAITLCRRPAYTLQMLTALSMCYGLGDYKVLMSLDWDERHDAECRQVHEMALSFKADVGHARAQVYLHKPRLGIDENKMWLIPTAFQETDFVIVLEDDIIPTPDFLRYMEWGRRTFRDDPSVLSVSGYHRATQAGNAAQLYDAFRMVGFNTWGWGMWQDRWETYFGNGAAYRKYAGSLVNGLFDRFFRDISIQSKLSTVCPVIARSQNIGALDGEHTVPADFVKTDFNAFGGWDFDLPDRSDWRLTSG